MKFLKQLFQSFVATGVMLLLVVFFMLVGVIPYNAEVFGHFLIGAAFLVIGQAVFLTAIDESIISVGKTVGSAIMKKRKAWIVILFGFVFGFVSTIAEPDVMVFASQISGLNPFLSTWFLLSLFSIACGLFVCFGFARILKNIPLKYILLGIYGIIIALCFVVPECYIGIAFDAGGTTTGCITVPFILAIAIGVCAIRGQNSKNDTFGIVAIASTGPILAVLILGAIFGTPTTEVARETLHVGLGETLISVIQSVGIAFLPLVLTFVIAQFVILKFPIKEAIRIFIGFIISALGLVVFLTGIYYGFEVMGEYIGNAVLLSPKWVFLILGVMLGFCIVFTDPAIVVLVQQVEEVTAGLLHKKVIYITLAIGVALAVMLAFVHIMFSVSLLYLLIPICALTLILNFFIPKIFTAIAFDSGGIASGTMAVGFILPICLGICEAMQLDSLISGFGIIGLVATVPILTVQIFGLIFRIKSNKLKSEEEETQDEKAN